MLHKLYHNKEFKAEITTIKPGVINKRVRNPSIRTRKRREGNCPSLRLGEKKRIQAAVTILKLMIVQKYKNCVWWAVVKVLSKENRN